MNQHNKSCLAFTVSSNLLKQEFPPTKGIKKRVKHSFNLETIHNHGSVKNGSISNSTYLSTFPPCSMILGKKTIHPLHVHRLMLPRCKTGKRFRPPQQQEGLTFWYCWWNKSCTCWCSRYPNIPGFIGFYEPPRWWSPDFFLPSTEVHEAWVIWVGLKIQYNEPLFSAPQASKLQGPLRMLNTASQCLRFSTCFAQLNTAGSERLDSMMAGDGERTDSFP